jgi:membrane protease YdiL (CAAX protease family)
MQAIKSIPSKIHLFSSLGLFVLGIGMLTAYYSMHGFDALDDNAIGKLVSQLPLYLVFLMVIFIAPVYEEVVFRLWVTGMRWAFWTTAALIIVFGWLMHVYLLIAIGVGLLLYQAFAKTLNLTNTKGVLFFVLSSLSFALAHLNPSNPWSYSAIQVVYYTGVGGLLAYVGLRYGFRYSVVSHIVFNALIVFVTFFAEKQRDLHFTLDMDTEVSLTANSIFSFPSNSHVVLDDDSVYYESTLTSILIGISPEKRQYLMVDNGDGFFRYTLTATSKSGSINLGNLRDALVERLPISIDTTEVDAYCLRFDEQVAADIPTQENVRSHTISSLAYMIRSNHGIPVLVCDTISPQDKMIQINTDFYFVKSESELRQYLRDRGVLIDSESDRRIKRIDFSERY